MQLAMIRRVWRVAAVGVVTLLTLGALAACDGNIALGPMALRGAGSDLEVVFCQDVQATAVFGQVRHVNSPWKTFWDLKGAHQIVAGDSFSVSGGIIGLQGVIEPTRVKQGENLLFLVTDSAGHSYMAGFTRIPAEVLRGSEWLHPDGRRSKDPCSGTTTEPSPNER